MRVKRLTETAKLPTKAHATDLGFDLYADVAGSVRALHGAVISTGIAIEFPEGFGGIIKDRSSLASIGLSVMGGVIDSDYRGEIKVILYNCDEGTYYIGKGNKIAQLILVPVIHEEIEETTEPFLQTVRGDKGFGSSGQ